MTQTSLQAALQNMQVDPSFERFPGRMADDVAKAMDDLRLSGILSRFGRAAIARQRLRQLLWSDCKTRSRI